MKKALLIINALLFSFLSFSQQQIGNGDMETWTGLGTASEEPANWNSFKTASGGLAAFAAQQIWRSTNIRAGAAGTYCAQIKCVSILGVPANGNVTLGKVNMGSSTATSSSNYNKSFTTDVNFSEPLTDTPDSIVFWVKYTPVNNTHQARMSTVLHDTYDYIDGYNVDALSAPHKVGDASLNFSTTNGLWVRKAVAFVYTGPASPNTFILATFATNMTPGVGSVNDEVLIDDVQLIYNPVNQPVDAVNDAVSTFQDIAVDVSVLSNDSDPENDLDLGSLVILTQPNNGTVSIDNVTGVITYTPDAGWFGIDTYTYTICDNGTPVLCDNAIVTVTVTEVIAGNNQIIANNDVASTVIDNSVVTNVVANDVDFENQIDLSSLIVTVTPTNGSTSVNNSTGEITYTPNLGYFGLDSYTYSICDAGTPAITCDEALVSVTVDLNWGIEEVNNSTFNPYVFEQHLFMNSTTEISGNYIIYSTNGQLIQSGEIESNISFNHPTGIYFIHIQTTKGNLTQKFSNQ